MVQPWRAWKMRDLGLKWKLYGSGQQSLKEDLMISWQATPLYLARLKDRWEIPRKGQMLEVYCISILFCFQGSC